MNFQDKKRLNKNLILIAIFTLSSFLTSFWLGLYSINRAKVLGDSIDITASVYGCRLDLLIEPEHRIVGNWNTQVEVTIYSENNDYLGSFNTTIDQFGFTSTNLCELPTPIYLTKGNYKLLVKGYSHITKFFTISNGFVTALTIVNLSSQGPLEAGDINFPPDDEINSLDSTNIIRTLGSIDGINPEYNNRFDLNSDGKIDINDLNYLIANFYKTGDSI